MTLISPPPQRPGRVSLGCFPTTRHAAGDPHSSAEPSSSESRELLTSTMSSAAWWLSIGRASPATSRRLQRRRHRRTPDAGGPVNPGCASATTLTTPRRHAASLESSELEIAALHLALSAAPCGAYAVPARHPCALSFCTVPGPGVGFDLNTGGSSVMLSVWSLRPVGVPTRAASTEANRPALAKESCTMLLQRLLERTCSIAMRFPCVLLPSSSVKERRSPGRSPTFQIGGHARRLAMRSARPSRCRCRSRHEHANASANLQPAGEARRPALAMPSLGPAEPGASAACPTKALADPSAWRADRRLIRLVDVQPDKQRQSGRWACRCRAPRPCLPRRCAV